MAHMQMSCNQHLSTYVLSHLNYTVKYGALVWFFYGINAIYLHWMLFCCIRDVILYLVYVGRSGFEVSNNVCTYR